MYFPYFYRDATGWSPVHFVDWMLLAKQARNIPPEAGIKDAITSRRAQRRLVPGAYTAARF
jgi:hypothetical protein